MSAIPLLYRPATISADNPPTATTSKMNGGKAKDHVIARDRQMASLACTVGNSLLRG